MPCASSCATTAVTVSPDGASVVTSMQEAALHGWRLRDGQHMRMSGYPVKVRCLSWSAKGRFLCTSGAQASICWPFHYKDGPMGKRPLELGPRQEMVTSVAAHPFEEIAAIGYEDGMILLVRFADGEEVLLRRAGAAPVSALGWEASGLELAFGTEAGLFVLEGVPSVVCGPGGITEAHRPDEHVELAQLARCRRFVEGLLDELSER